MLRWIRNLFIGIVISLTICYAVGALGDGESVWAVFIICSIIGLMLTGTVWALGLTRLSKAKLRQRSSVILSYVEQAVTMNLPLPRLLLAAEASEPPWIARRITRLRKHLEAGGSITDALRAVMPANAQRKLALIGAAERIGQIGPELRRLVSREYPLQSKDIAERSFLRSYPVALAGAIAFILAVISIFVLPKFEMIFHDFHCPLPPLTVFVLGLLDVLDATGWLAVAATIVLLVVVIQQIRHRSARYANLRWFTTNRDLADICHVISQALAAGQPLDTAIHAARDLSISPALRRKLSHWADGLQGGIGSADAATSAGMPRLIAGLSLSREGFDFLSRYYANKFSRLMILLRAAAIPAMVFVFGILVAIVALTLFLPIVRLIDVTNASTGFL